MYVIPAFLLAFIDDHSRLVPHGRFYLSEGISPYLDALEQALLRRGIPRKLYLDNGPAFRSKRENGRHAWKHQ